MKITKRQLRRIIREEKARLQEQSKSNFENRGGEIYDALEDVVMAHIDVEADFMTLDDWNAFEASVVKAMDEMKERVLDPRESRSGWKSVSIAPGKGSSYVP